MLEKINPSRVIFLDIETASVSHKFEQLPEFLKKQWAERIGWQIKDGETVEGKFEAEAGLHSEFSRVICAVVGKLVEKEGRQVLQLKGVAHQNEADLLTELADIFSKIPADVYVAAYNGKGFDLPTLARRMLINGIKIPEVLDLSDKKPWEARIIDPMDLFRFGERRHFCKMDLMAGLLGIESSKTGISGPDISGVYWSGGLDKIVEYCKSDVRVLAQIVLKMKGMPIDFDIAS